MEGCKYLGEGVVPWRGESTLERGGVPWREGEYLGGGEYLGEGEYLGGGQEYLGRGGVPWGKRGIPWRLGRRRYQR